ncbi:uncharacterized protein LOC129582414 [Paramacrobiotus metropolitanus]|uniref:uncharacterized protein LOC129582414 n=1 Tax=Paramacrobiotus metropolitanus TaxID=2943436 RepID=UPI0024458B3C|nr:uncharacterized protein LOC129582414 [Paramacrobiotus metropolitanus]
MGKQILAVDTTAPYLQRVRLRYGAAAQCALGLRCLDFQANKCLVEVCDYSLVSTATVLTFHRHHRCCAPLRPISCCPLLPPPCVSPTPPSLSAASPRHPPPPSTDRFHRCSCGRALGLAAVCRQYYRAGFTVKLVYCLGVAVASTTTAGGALGLAAVVGQYHRAGYQVKLVYCAGSRISFTGAATSESRLKMVPMTGFISSPSPDWIRGLCLLKENFRIMDRRKNTTGISQRRMSRAQRRKLNADWVGIFMEARVILWGDSQLRRLYFCMNLPHRFDRASHFNIFARYGSINGRIIFQYTESGATYGELLVDLIDRARREYPAGPPPSHQRKKLFLQAGTNNMARFIWNGDTANTDEPARTVTVSLEEHRNLLQQYFAPIFVIPCPPIKQSKLPFDHPPRHEPSCRRAVNLLNAALRTFCARNAERNWHFLEVARDLTMCDDGIHIHEAEAEYLHGVMDHALTVVSEARRAHVQAEEDRLREERERAARKAEKAGRRTAKRRLNRPAEWKKKKEKRKQLQRENPELALEKAEQNLKKAEQHVSRQRQEVERIKKRIKIG